MSSLNLKPYFDNGTTYAFMRNHKKDGMVCVYEWDVITDSLDVAFTYYQVFPFGS